MHYGEKIRKIREQKGFKQDYLANKLGISTTAFSKWESGETKIATDRLEELAKILKTEVGIISNFNHLTNLNNHKSLTIAISNNPVYHELEKFNEQLQKDKSYLQDLLAKSEERVTQLLERLFKYEKT